MRASNRELVLNVFQFYIVSLELVLHIPKRDLKNPMMPLKISPDPDSVISPDVELFIAETCVLFEAVPLLVRFPGSFVAFVELVLFKVSFFTAGDTIGEAVAFTTPPFGVATKVVLFATRTGVGHGVTAGQWT